MRIVSIVHIRVPKYLICQYTLHPCKPMDYLIPQIPQIVWSANQGHRFLLCILHRFRNSKIRQLEYSFLIDKYILRFDVPMYNLPLMQILHPQDQLYKQIHDQGFFEILIAFLPILDIDWEISIWMMILLHSQYSMMMMSISFSRKYSLNAMMLGCFNCLWISI